LKTDEQDRTKKAVAHVGTTSRRIRFHEVELQPKAGADDNGVQKTLGLPKGSSSKRRRNAKGKTRVEKTDEADAVMDEETSPALRHSGRQGVPSTTAKEKAKARESLIFGGSENPIQNDDYIGEEVEEENGVDNGKDD
jgi:phage tail sheath protein FI